MESSNNRRQKRQIALESTRGGKVERTIQRTKPKAAAIDFEDFPPLTIPKPPSPQLRRQQKAAEQRDASDRCYNLWEHLDADQ